MITEEVRDFCLTLRAVTEGFPFGADALVFKVKGKMFAMIGLDTRLLNLKCDMEKAIALREQYADVTPGYHMSKVHWNTINLDGTLPEELIQEWIRESYALVVKGLPAKERNKLV
jgi:predicted DNA-binding protein (MmcQ/YjbR family)